MNEEPARPRVAPRPSLLHLDADVVIADKPSGVLSVAGRGSAANLPDLIRTMPGFGPGAPLRVIHRLEREASGVIVYGRSLRGQQALVEQFMNRTAEKVYIAVVLGYVAGDGEVNLPLRFDKNISAVKVSPGRGKPALTRYRILERVAGNTVLECRPVTGRMHQIRVHLAAIGHPLTVDPLYGGGTQVLLSSYKSGYRPSSKHVERPLIARLTLHAQSLTVRLPDAAEPSTFTAPLPKDMRATIQQLGRALKR